MLPKYNHDLSCAHLIIYIWLNSHLERKKRAPNKNIEDLGGMGVAMMPIFFSASQTHTYLLKLKKIMSQSQNKPQNRLIFAFYSNFSIFNPIFVDGEIIGKTLPLLNFKRPQIVDEGVGTPTCCRKGSPGNNWPPKTPISMCGHQAQGQNSATKSSARKNLREI